MIFLSEQFSSMPIQFRCPVCRKQLHPREKGAYCDNNHQFDRAKQGYLNLLPSHKMRSKNPGDDKDMVQARTRFLNAGHYQPVIQQIIETIHSLYEGQNELTLFDAGCGEGFYTSEIKQALPDSQICGLDIAKPAIVACSKRNKSIEWLVGSVADLPLMDQQFDVVISIFSRCDWQEFTRILKPGGHALVLAPGQEHLLELRQAIYEEVRPYPVDKQVEELPEALQLVNNKSVTALMNLPDSQTIMDLLAMTPHYWHVKPAQKEKLLQLSQLECRLDMRLYTIQKTIQKTL